MEMEHLLEIMDKNDPFSMDCWIFHSNKVNIMSADTLASCFATSPTKMAVIL